MTEYLEALIEEGHNITAKEPGDPDPQWADDAGFFGWKASSLNALDSLSIDNNLYLKIFIEEVSNSEIYRVNRGISILESLLNDIKKGYLLDIENTIISNTYTGLLETSLSYLEDGHKEPAGVLAGVALEDTIRRMGSKYLKDYKDFLKFGSINSKLSKVLPYNDAKRNEIDSWYKIRDLANHAKWDEFDEGQVRGMVECTNKLIADYL